MPYCLRCDSDKIQSPAQLYFKQDRRNFVETILLEFALNDSPAAIVRMVREEVQRFANDHGVE